MSGSGSTNKEPARGDGCACGHSCEHGPHEVGLDHALEPICYGCPHCGCDPADRKDFCRTCERCDREQGDLGG